MQHLLAEMLNHASGVKMEIITYKGGAQAGTPRTITAMLNKEIARGLEAPEVKERFTALGMEAIGGTPDEFAAVLRAKTAKWGKVVRTANIKVE